MNFVQPLLVKYSKEADLKMSSVRGVLNIFVQLLKTYFTYLDPPLNVGSSAYIHKKGRLRNTAFDRAIHLQYLEKYIPPSLKKKTVSRNYILSLRRAL